jgi:hypothetical protein
MNDEIKKSENPWLQISLVDFFYQNQKAENSFNNDSLQELL